VNTGAVNPDRDTAWCDDLERLLRQRRIRLRYRRTTPRGHRYALGGPSGAQASVWVPRSAVAAGVYGLAAALVEIENALDSAARNEAEWLQPSVALKSASRR
jgi:hypothetical protein